MHRLLNSDLKFGRDPNSGFQIYSTTLNNLAYVYLRLTRLTPWPHIFHPKSEMSLRAYCIKHGSCVLFISLECIFGAWCWTRVGLPRTSHIGPGVLFRCMRIHNNARSISLLSCKMHKSGRSFFQKKLFSGVAEITKSWVECQTLHHYPEVWFHI